MAEAFTDDECLELICNIKRYEFLYNPTNKHYKNKVKRQQAWNDVVSKVGKPKGHCKKKWDLIRQRFIRCYKKQKKQKNSGVVEEDTWGHYKLLDFLHVIIPKRSPKKVKNAVEEEVEEDEDDVFSETEDFHPKKVRKANENLYMLESDSDIGIVPIKIVNENNNVEEEDEEFTEEIKRRLRKLPGHLKDKAKENILNCIEIIESRYKE